MRLIIRLKLDRIQARMRLNRNIAFSYDDALVESIAARCTEVDSGARNVDHILTDTLLPELSRRILEHMAHGIKIDAIHLGVDAQGFIFDFREAPAPGAVEQPAAVIKNSVSAKNRKPRKARSSEPVH